MKRLFIIVAVLTFLIGLVALLSTLSAERAAAQAVGGCTPDATRPGYCYMSWDTKNEASPDSTLLLCPAGRPMVGIEFTHTVHQNETHQEAVRIWCGTPKP